LDDCEIQIVSSLQSTILTSLTKITQLEAKWYLEHQLAINRARRAQKASENAHAANKRKLDLVTDEQNGDAGKMEENPAKRIKVQDTKESNGLVAEGTATRVEDAEAAAIDATQNPNVNNEPPSQSTEAAKETVEETDRPNQAAERSQPTAAAPKKPPDLNTTNGTNPISTDFASQEEPKTSGPATSIDENQGFNFDSMFDDANEGGDGNNADLDFDMELGTDAFSNVINGQNKGQADKSTSLDSLLPGLETYPNQTGDEMMVNFNSSNDGAGGPSTNEFDLPDLGDSTFDDLLNDNSFGGDMGGTGDDMLNDDSMMDLGEFDSFFN
jgi:hypothetical protein